MKLKTIVVDDEPLALEMMKAFAGKTSFLEVQAAFDNAVDALQYLENNSGTDLLLLDIQMPELTGMDLANILTRKNLAEQPYIIFTTAYDKYALQGYKVNAVDYLLKPVMYEDFYNAADKVRTLKAASARTLRGDEDYIFIKSGSQMEKIMLNDIKYIEGVKDYLKIYLRSQATPVMTLMSMKKMETLLPEEVFMRIHRSYIVSLNAMKSLSKTTVFLDDAKYIVVGTNYRAAFDKFYESWTE